MFKYRIFRGRVAGAAIALALTGSGSNLAAHDAAPVAVHHVGTALAASATGDLAHAYQHVDENALRGTAFDLEPPGDPSHGRDTLADTLNALPLVSPGTQFAGFNAIQPVRLLDTRNGIGAPRAPVGEGQTITLAVRSQGGIPADADAVVLNVTATEPTLGGYITVWPTGVAQPVASSLNTRAGVTVANMVVTRIGVDGTVSISNPFGTVQLLADAVAWSRADNHFHAQAPQRILDTRSGLGISHTLTPNETADLPIAGVAGLPATGIGVAVLNVTATRPSAISYLTVFPAGTTKPNASSLNFAAEQTVPNLVFATVGTTGKISIFNAAGTVDVIADLVGWIPSGGAYIPVPPTRVMDSRVGQGDYGVAATASTTLVKPSGRLPAQRVDLDLRALYSAYGTVAAYAFNITVTNPSTDGYLSVWPAGTTQPQVSSLNYRAGQTIANAVIIKPGTFGRISMAIPTGTIDVLVDLVGIVPLQNSLDTPDDTGGSSFHVLFVQGADAAPDPAMIPAVQNEVAAFDGYLFAQTGRHLSIDHANGQPEITTWKIPTMTTAQLVAWPEDPGVTALIQLAQDGFGNPYTRRWLVYIDGARAGGLCGVTLGQWTTLYRTSACGTVNGTITANTVGTYANTAQVALHEMFHGIGAVPSCAPNYANSTATDPNYSPNARTGHSNIPNDLMYWNAGIQPKTIDTQHLDYIGTANTTCPDLAQSPYITKP